MIVFLFGSKAPMWMVVLCFIIMPIAIAKYVFFIVHGVRAWRREKNENS